MLGSYFQRLSPNDALHVTIVSLAVLLAVVGVLAHHVTRIPGPVTPDERAATGRRRLRWLGWTRLLLALVAWLAILIMLFPPRSRESLMLFSRARTERVRNDKNVVPARPNDHCDAPARATTDLGPAVDAVLGRLDPNIPWELASSREREAAEHLIATSDRPVGPGTTWSLAAKRHITGAVSAPPPWLVESIELSLVLIAVRERNVQTVYIAPAPQLRVDAWRILGDILAEEGVTVCLVDPPPSADEKLRITRLANARLHRDEKTISVWAVIDGKTPQDIGARTLPLRVHTPSRTVDVRYVVDHDDRKSRLVLICLGSGCKTSSPSDESADVAAAGLAQGAEVTVTSPTGNSSTAPATLVLLDNGTLERPVLSASLASDRALLHSVFDEERFFPSNLDGVHAELEALGVSWPTTISRPGATRHAVVARGPSFFVIASDDQTAQAAIAAGRELARPGDATGGRTRVTRSEMGPRTVFSWMYLAPPGQTGETPHLAATDDDVTASIDTATQLDSAPHYEPFAGLVHLKEVETRQRYAIVALDLGNPAWPTDIFSGLPLIRTIAWASDWVSQPDDRSPLKGQDDLSATTSSTPLVTEYDLGTAQRDALHIRDLICLALIGAYLFSTWQARLAVRRRKP